MSYIFYWLLVHIGLIVPTKSFTNPHHVVHTISFVLWGYPADAAPSRKCFITRRRAVRPTYLVCVYQFLNPNKKFLKQQSARERKYNQNAVFRLCATFHYDTAAINQKLCLAHKTTIIRAAVVRAQYLIGWSNYNAYIARQAFMAHRYILFYLREFHSEAKL